MSKTPNSPKEPSDKPIHDDGEKQLFEKIVEIYSRAPSEYHFIDQTFDISLPPTYDRPDDDANHYRNIINRYSHLPRVKLQDEIADLRKEINEKTRAITDAKADVHLKDGQLADLQRDYKNLKEKEDLAHLLSRVGAPAQSKILGDSEFRSKFTNESRCESFVLSIDIRRSTELMLKAREPKLYAEFIIKLATLLRECVLKNFGIFDKFTGDGILAFFPEFYSGKDAGYRAVFTAAECHAIFNAHYAKNRHCFVSILNETGLGIGLDYGLVQIVEVGGEISVVGTPVVYACRMAGADAGKIFANQPAYEQLFENYSAFDFSETEIPIKHEGRTLAYSIQPNGKTFAPEQPAWLSS